MGNADGDAKEAVRPTACTASDPWPGLCRRSVPQGRPPCRLHMGAGGHCLAPVLLRGTGQPLSAARGRPQLAAFQPCLGFRAPSATHTLLFGRGTCVSAVAPTLLRGVTPLCLPGLRPLRPGRSFLVRMGTCCGGWGRDRPLLPPLATHPASCSSASAVLKLEIPFSQPWGRGWPAFGSRSVALGQGVSEGQWSSALSGASAGTWLRRCGQACGHRGPHAVLWGPARPPHHPCLQKERASTGSSTGYVGPEDTGAVSGVWRLGHGPGPPLPPPVQPSVRSGAPPAPVLTLLRPVTARRFSVSGRRGLSQQHGHGRPPPGLGLRLPGWPLSWERTPGRPGTQAGERVTCRPSALSLVRRAVVGRRTRARCFSPPWGGWAPGAGAAGLLGRCCLGTRGWGRWLCLPSGRAACSRLRTRALHPDAAFHFTLLCCLSGRCVRGAGPGLLGVCVSGTQDPKKRLSPRQRPAMGDMKTPDFDDLLAAFDIPDPTSLDAKEAIQAPGEDSEGPLKPPGMCVDEAVSLAHAGSGCDVPAVSVIVKNTSRQEPFEVDKDHASPGLLHNGFRGPDLPPEPHGPGPGCGKFDPAFMNGDSTRSFPGRLEPPKAEPLPTFSQFSPISSPESEEAVKDNGFGGKPRPSDSYFSPPPGGGSVLAALAKLPELHMFDHFCKKEPRPEPVRLGSPQGREQARQKAAEPPEELDASRFFGDALAFSGHPGNSIGEPRAQASELASCSAVPPRQRLKPAHSRLSSCVAALVALQAKRVAGATKEEQPGHTKDPAGPPKEGPKGSPKTPKSPKSPRSPPEAARKSARPPDSPRSVCSDSSSRGSPSVATSSPPAIPKVRIKTIKTSSGEITRTVTRILPDPDDPSKSPAGSPLGSAAAEAAGEGPEDEPLALPGAELAPEAGTHSGSPQGHRRADDRAKKACEAALSPGGAGAPGSMGPGQGPPAGKKPPPGPQASTPAPAPLLPKAVHLANLNLVPHSVAASVTAKCSAQRHGQPPPPQMAVPLVHQVRRAAPPAAELFRKVLHGSNPVPRYAPDLSPPAGSSIRVPAGGYCCVECGDAFALEKSLSQHYGRRSVHIEVLCTLCAQTLLFFNKCSLLRHARDHKGRGLAMQCSQLLVRPIPADQMFAAPPAGSPAPAPPAAPAPAQQSVPAGGAGGPLPALPLYPDPVRLVRHGVKCLECHRQMRDYVAMAAHFQRTAEDAEGLVSEWASEGPAAPPGGAGERSVRASGRAAAVSLPRACVPAGGTRARGAAPPRRLPCRRPPPWRCGLALALGTSPGVWGCPRPATRHRAWAQTCQVCQMLLPNQCSFCAHQRTHAHKSPYCCPECGVLCRSAYFQTHVKENCLHYARKVGYRCIHCGVVHLTLALLKGHIQERHCQVFHKCAFCPMAFKTARSTADHSSAQHPAQPHRPSQLIYKCSCEMVFSKKRHVQLHFYQNAREARVGVFKCPECPLLFLQKPELMQHVKNTHGVPRNVDELSSLQPPGDPSPGRPGPRVPAEPPAASAVSRGSSLPSGRWGRPEAHRRAEARPRLRSTGWTCQECQEWVPDRESYVSHMKKSHGRALKRYPCRQCEQSFHTPNSLRKHVRNNHDTAKRVYTCGYCGEDSPSFPRPSLLESHISLMHGVRDPDLGQASRPAPAGGQPPRANHLKRPGSGTGDAAGTSRGATKRHKPLFRCAKCSFASDSGLAFQSHIPQHQVDSSTAQCPLCGLCYTSAGSLGRHLFIVHKVRDQEEEAGAGPPEQGSPEELPLQAPENGLEDGASGPSPGDIAARQLCGPDPGEDSAPEAPSPARASQDQDCRAPSPQV
ncbi:Zinc finger protein 592 [Galemys pyrenaicus]|uniref:Zinc finger protein 592 n=1 Tax=Galemys pyrenaicus TaxID=202257 RepID=A0A8J6ADF7_GALPY|nr:Zinc finger protein 592 [Galemys pyrenaicus]